MMHLNGRPALIVDPHEVARWGLVQILQTKRFAQFSHEASSIEVAMRLAVEHQPGLVITEMKLVDGSGLKLVKWLKKQSIESRILVYTGRTEPADAERAMLAGAHGFLNKSDSVNSLKEAIQSVIAGDFVVSPQFRDLLARSMVIRRVDQGAAFVTPNGILSSRELQVFEMIGEGRTVSEISKTLRISTKTVEAHRQNIRKKMGWRSMSELIGRAAVWTTDN